MVSNHFEKIEVVKFVFDSAVKRAYFVAPFNADGLQVCFGDFEADFFKYFPHGGVERAIWDGLKDWAKDSLGIKVHEVDPDGLLDALVTNLRLAS